MKRPAQIGGEADRRETLDGASHGRMCLCQLAESKERLACGRLRLADEPPVAELARQRLGFLGVTERRQWVGAFEADLREAPQHVGLAHAIMRGPKATEAGLVEPVGLVEMSL